MKHAIRLLAGVCLASLVATPSHGQSDETAAKEIGAYLGRLEKLGFAGSLVISKGGTPMLAAGYGLANRELGIPWGPATVSTIGSITKHFTSTHFSTSQS